jgi:carbon storage regulator
MLIVRRFENEDIKIGPDVRVVVLAIERDRVKIGIEAPPHVIIVRGELERDTTRPTQGAALSDDKDDT